MADARLTTEQRARIVGLAHTSLTLTPRARRWILANERRILAGQATRAPEPEPLLMAMEAQCDAV